MEKLLSGELQLKEELTIPPSKSQTMRAILFATMAKGQSTIRNYLDSHDTMRMIEACRSLGAEIDVYEDCLEIEGVDGIPKTLPQLIDAGNSGIILRFLGAIAALGEQPVEITGDDATRKNRPVKELLRGLDHLGAHAYSKNRDRKAPIIVQGPLKSGECVIKGDDSQPVSALLIASAFTEGVTDLHILEPGEIPWVAMTLDWFKRLGIEHENFDFGLIKVKGKTSYLGFDYDVPGDFSSAAFPVAAAMLSKGEMTLHNLDIHDMQGDKALLRIFQVMGAEISFEEKEKKVVVKGGNPLKGIMLDINDIIDAIPILAVVGSAAEGETLLKNGAIAREKECDRLTAIVKELQKMGADIEEREDGLIVRKSKLKGATVACYNDHRMVMALAVAAFIAEGETTLDDTTSLSKTYTNFFEELFVNPYPAAVLV